jgi:hypothetical protein
MAYAAEVDCMRFPVDCALRSLARIVLQACSCCGAGRFTVPVVSVGHPSGPGGYPLTRHRSLVSKPKYCEERFPVKSGAELSALAMPLGLYPG